MSNEVEIDILLFLKYENQLFQIPHRIIFFEIDILRIPNE